MDNNMLYSKPSMFQKQMITILFLYMPSNNIAEVLGLFKREPN